MDLMRTKGRSRRTQKDASGTDNWDDVPELRPAYVLKGGGLGKRPKDHLPDKP